MRLPKASGPRAQKWPFLPVAYGRPHGRCIADSRTRRWLCGPACYSYIIRSSQQAALETLETARSGLANTVHPFLFYQWYTGQFIAHYR